MFEFSTPEFKEMAITGEVLMWFGSDIFSVSKVEAHFRDSFIERYSNCDSGISRLQQLDLVIIGLCSLMLDMMYENSYLENTPFNKAEDLMGCVIQNILHSCKESQKKIKSILIIPRCCGKFSTFGYVYDDRLRNEN